MAISLHKDETVNLTQAAALQAAKPGKQASGLSKVFMGVGWDVAQATPAKSSGGLWGGLFGGGNSSGGGGSIDLDASCLIFDARHQLLDQVWFRQLTGMKGAVQHTGDNVTGAGEGDDEVINVNLAQLPSQVASLVFTVNSFRGQTFDRVQNAFCRLVDASNQQELARFDLRETGTHTGLVMARLFREGEAWHLQALGEKTQGRTFQEMLPLIQSCLAR